MQSNDFLLQFIEQNLLQHLETRKTEFSFSENIFYRKGDDVIPSSSKIVDELKENLRRNSIFLRTNQKNEQNESISFLIKYDQFQEEFTFVLLPTKSEIENLDEREKLREQFFEEDLARRILKLTPSQSVTLINEVLGDDSLPWIKEFKLNPKASDDEGVDFFAKLCINKNNLIDYDGYGKNEEIIGQLKHYNSRVQPGEIRDFIGTMKNKKKKFGLFIASNGFTKRALDAVSESKYTIFCEDITFISKLIIKQKIGLKKINFKSGYFVDEEWWDEIKKFS